MKVFLFIFSILITGVCFSQKYVLLDKQMILPITYANKVTPEQTYRGIFPVEKKTIKKFIQELDKISKQLAGKLTKPDAFDFSVGYTAFRGIKVILKEEERLDIVLTTNCANSKILMHLSDSKSSNAKNAFYLNTWIKYIKESLK